ncbi:hypothetical protein SUGI_1142120 [Cryptomeria japonica]|nr:hypothetical protein SUGI_1142120 [Cryptomeria japonica]
MKTVMVLVSAAIEITVAVSFVQVIEVLIMGQRQRVGFHPSKSEETVFQTMQDFTHNIFIKDEVKIKAEGT